MTQPNTQAPADERAAFEADTLAFESVYNRVFRGRCVDTKLMADCEEIWRAALALQPAQAETTLPEAMAVVSKAMRDDPDYAWSWHCNIAMASVDEGMEHYAANKAAARFMSMLADVDTTKHPGFPTPPKAQPAPVAVGERKLSNSLWCDLKSDAERSVWLLMGRGVETGVVCKALQTDLSLAYSRLDVLQRTAATVECLTDEQIDRHLDAVLRAAGSALQHYTLQKSKDDMRAAMRAALQSSRSGQAGGDAGGGVPRGYCKVSETIDVFTFYDRLCDAVAEAGAVDTVIGRPEALRKKLASLRDDIGRAANGRIATIPQPAAVSAEGEPATAVVEGYPDDLTDQQCQDLWCRYPGLRDWINRKAAVSAEGVPKGWTDRHRCVAMYALHRFASSARNLADQAAQKTWRGDPDAYKHALADARDAEAARAMLVAATAATGQESAETMRAAMEVGPRMAQRHEAATVRGAGQAAGDLLARAVKALGDLSFECDGVFVTLPPSRETYNRTFAELQALRTALAANKEQRG